MAVFWQNLKCSTLRRQPKIIVAMIDSLSDSEIQWVKYPINCEGIHFISGHLEILFLKFKSQRTTKVIQVFQKVCVWGTGTNRFLETCNISRIKPNLNLDWHLISQHQWQAWQLLISDLPNTEFQKQKNTSRLFSLLNRMYMQIEELLWKIDGGSRCDHWGPTVVRVRGWLANSLEVVHWYNGEFGQ